MSAEQPHKFDEPLQVTRLQYYKDAFAQAVAVIRDLEPVFGREKVHEAVRVASEKRACEGVAAMMASEGTNIQSLQDFKQDQLAMWENPRIKKTHTCSMTQDTSDQVEFTVTECIWAKVFQELGAPDIGSLMMCQTDFAVARLFNPHIRLVRTKTIMDGQSVCDFRYLWDEE
jgi:predicted ArsR family transcriptional regulator